MSRARLQKLFAALLALAVWQGAALLVHAPILLPSPLQVAGRLSALVVTADFGAPSASVCCALPEAFS